MSELNTIVEYVPGGLSMHSCDYLKIGDKHEKVRQDTWNPVELHIKNAEEAIEGIKKLIPAMKWSLKATWIGGELGYCSACGHEGCASDIWNRCDNKYCPNCGCRIVYEEEAK